MTRLISNRHLESLSTEDKINYFENLKNECLKIRQAPYAPKKVFRDMIRGIYKFVRTYEYEIIGDENIPADGRVLFICNHTNSHDFFTPLEVLQDLGIESTTFSGSDDLNAATQMIFAGCDAVLANRNDKNSLEKGVINFSAKMLGKVPVAGVIYGEATWNLHPYKPMQTLKIGGANIAAITDLPIVPTVIEYVPVQRIVRRESDMYERCIVKFGKPIKIDREKSLISQTMLLQKTMETMRRELWRNLGYDKDSLKDVNTDLYLNQTYLKKFDGFGFTYDSESEAKFLFSKDGNPVDNEYTLSKEGILVPGITTKNGEKKLLPKRK